jgi:hypothetical protein
MVNVLSYEWTVKGKLLMEFSLIGDVVGVCFLDKFCFTNVFGFEILKD